MGLGESTFEIETTGGQQSPGGASVARTILAIGVSTGGAENAVFRAGSASGISSGLDRGPLAEAVAMYLRQGRTVYAVPATPSVAGKKGAVTQVGTDAGTVTPSLAPHKLIYVKCITGGALGTATFKFSLDGGVTYGDLFTSTATSYVVRVPGTFCTLTFAAATYVATKTLTVATDGTVTPGSAWVGTVTQVSSPVDSYDVVVTVIGGGALGAFSIRVSLDGGQGALPDFAVPASGVVVVPGTGIVLTLASTFTDGETYSFLTVPPGFSTSDLSNALAAFIADQSAAAALVHVVNMPSTASSAFSAAAVLDAALIDWFDNYSTDMQGLCECPVVGDNVVSGGNAIADTTDTDSVIRTARVGLDFKRTAVAAGSHRMSSRLVGGTKLKRPFGWALASRFVDTDPREDLSKVALGKLPIDVIGRDEAATPGLDEIQLNVARTYRNRPGAYLAITDGGFGFKHLTTDASYQCAGAVRGLNGMIRRLRNVAQSFLGESPTTNADGTPTKDVVVGWSARIDGAAKRSVGLLSGGDYVKPQASSVTASVLASSQLGASPHRLETEYDYQSLGFVSAVHGVVRFGGVLTTQGA